MECRQRTNSDVWFTTWLASFPDFFIFLRCYTVIGKQLMISNDRNRVRWEVLSLSQDGALTDFFENLSVNILKGDLSNATTFNPPLFSLVNTFKQLYSTRCLNFFKYRFLPSSTSDKFNLQQLFRKRNVKLVLTCVGIVSLKRLLNESDIAHSKLFDFAKISPKIMVKSKMEVPLHFYTHLSSQ